MTTADTSREVDTEVGIPDYRVRVSQRARYAHLKVLYDGTVEVVVPRRYNQKRIPEFVAENREWLRQALETHEQHRQDCPERFESRPGFVDLKAAGEYFSVIYREELSSRLLEKGSLINELEVSYRDESEITSLLGRWLSQKAKQVLVPWLRNVSEETGLNVNRVSIRAQRTRWASCSSECNITLNRSILFLPPELVRYLFIHELCHTRHMNHSQRFWALVRTFDRDYRDKERELDRLSSYIPLWVVEK